MSAVLRERYVSPLRSIYFCGSCWLCNSALVTHDGRGLGQDGLHLAGSSIIDTDIGLNGIDSLLL